MLAALASAAMPKTSVAGVCEHDEANTTDNEAGIDYAVVQDTAGRRYDVFVSSEEKGKKRLAGRVKAARVLAKSHEMSGLGFAVDRALAFSPAGTGSPTGKTSVLVTPHVEGEPRQLDLLTLQDASSVGTAIGAIHRQRTEFLTEAKYPSFTTGQIHAQLTGWIKRLQQAGHVPPAITSSWANIIETDGLWSFSTTLTHGGFSDGDFLFSDSTITEVSNWQDMQINDPARDLAWIFAKLDEDHRNALMSAYGRMMGSRVDDLILLRANLWLQMEQVGEFIEALGRADNTRILQFKAQVEHLAHQLTVVANKAAGAATAASAVVAPKNGSSSDSSDSADASPQLDDDATGETDKTGSAEITKLVEESDSTADRPAHFKTFSAHSLDKSEDDDRTNDKQSRIGHSAPLYSNMPNPSSSATMVLTEAGKASVDDDIDDESDETGETVYSHRNDDSDDTEASANKISWHVQYSKDDDTYDKSPAAKSISHDAPTTLIPQLEREEQALRDAQEGLEEAEKKANHSLSETTGNSDGSSETDSSEEVESADKTDSSDGIDKSSDSDKTEDTVDSDDTSSIDD
ncbi:aminoglycoside phosphotransferase [Bifidobacterium sp. ESL0682]|uniref:phosphotransferase n=1 Tax=Bifidobacterium sp. ESL0682 TaxID=2983212 RepID=UPI0023F73C81|nr:phosphotransferase [Bifidobacterium sp. ESL0682]WEV41654.1 aminoglycoside phosphotransferase [Bifidobacterium sp. ESL0682]